MSDWHILGIEGVAVVGYEEGVDEVRLQLNGPCRDLTRDQARELADLLTYATEASEPGYWEDNPIDTDPGGTRA